MRDIGDGFRIGERQFAWGSRLADVARALDVAFDDDGKPGWQRLSVPCGPSWGFETIGIDMTARGGDRPITVLHYELAAIAGDPQPDPDHWMSRLTGMHGAPREAGSHDLPRHADPSGSVRFSASWATGDQSVALSVYGGPRKVAFGSAAASLWVNWATVPAARPFLDAWRTRARELDRMAQFHSGIVTFTLSAAPNPAHGSAGLPHATALERDSDYALSSPQLLRTPPVIATALGARGIGFWRSGDRRQWCASNCWDSIVFDLGAPVVIDWYDIKPAKGGGFSEIAVQDWSARDFHGSRAVADAVGALQTIPGVTIRKVDGYDC